MNIPEPSLAKIILADLRSSLCGPIEQLANEFACPSDLRHFEYLLQHYPPSFDSSLDMSTLIISQIIGAQTHPHTSNTPDVVRIRLLSATVNGEIITVTPSSLLTPTGIHFKSSILDESCFGSTKSHILQLVQYYISNRLWLMDNAYHHYKRSLDCYNISRGQSTYLKKHFIINDTK